MKREVIYSDEKNAWVKSKLHDPKLHKIAQIRGRYGDDDINY